jgi:hypothetical protein
MGGVVMSGDVLAMLVGLFVGGILVSLGVIIGGFYAAGAPGLHSTNAKARQAGFKPPE